MYLEESLRAGGALTDALEDDLGDLQKALGLGVREAEDIRSEIVSRAYKCAVFLHFEKQLLLGWWQGRLTGCAGWCGMLKLTAALCSSPHRAALRAVRSWLRLVLQAVR